MFTVSAITIAVAMPLVGRLFDRFRTRYVFAGGLLITLLSLLAASLALDASTAIAYALVFGLRLRSSP